MMGSMMLPPRLSAGRWGHRPLHTGDNINECAARLPTSSVCRYDWASCAPSVQRGLGNAGRAVAGARFGEGAPGQPVWLDEVSCRGDEQRLEECAHAGWSVSNW